MTLLIFSCNRALQLQTLLDSLLLCLTVDGSYIVHVLYAAHDEAYQKGYEQLVRAYPGVRFHRERVERKWAWPLPGGYWKNLYRYLRQPGLQRTSNFKALTEQLIADSPQEGIMFLTDDSLFTRPVHLGNAHMAPVLSGQTYTYSLRHGLTLRPLPSGYQRHQSGGYVWKVTSNGAALNHWTWRFSVDGHLYPRRALLPILRRLHYANPNSLEGFVNEYITNVRPDLFNTLLFDEQPGLVGFILNKVQTFNANRSFDIAPAYLNNKLLAGYALRYVYGQPVTDFQPTLTAVELTNSFTGDQELVSVASS